MKLKKKKEKSGILTDAQKLSYANESLHLFVNCLEKASKNPIYHLKAGASPSPGNQAADLAKLLLGKTSINSDSFKVYSDLLASWIDPILDIDSNSASNRETQCVKFNEVCLDKDHQKAWETFLNATGGSEGRGSELLYQFVLRHFYQCSLTWRNKIMITTVDPLKKEDLEFSLEEEKILRYVAGYIPFSLRKKYWSQQENHVGKAVFALIDSWTIKEDKKSTKVSFFDYTKTWIERNDRGKLIHPNDELYTFVRRLERVARSVLNKDLVVDYQGEDVRELLLGKLTSNELIDKSWSSLTRNLESDMLAATLKIIIMKKWIGMRARAFVNSWIQAVKRQSIKTGKVVSDKSEPSLRKTLHVAKAKKSDTSKK